ncbi:DUF2695 domain-containing protein [Candidatus Poribacteria bacterium]|nr:DUF2695 domain-containing protein [Candidatus Poribacteria bacterium]
MKKEEFDKFYNILAGEEGCNVTDQCCICHSDHRFTKKILRKYFPKEDVNKFIAWCKSKGGYCDCEIIFNVEY